MRYTSLPEWREQILREELCLDRNHLQFALYLIKTGRISEW
jgi:hypothetical protein